MDAGEIRQTLHGVEEVKVIVKVQKAADNDRYWKEIRIIGDGEMVAEFSAFSSTRSMPKVDVQNEIVAGDLFDVTD